MKRIVGVWFDEFKNLNVTIECAKCSALESPFLPFTRILGTKTEVLRRSFETELRNALSAACKGCSPVEEK